MVNSQGVGARRDEFCGVLGNFSPVVFPTPTHCAARATQAQLSAT